MLPTLPTLAGSSLHIHRPEAPMHILHRTAVLLGAAALAHASASAAGLRAYAGVVVGNAVGNGGVFDCATSGPTLGGGWTGGLVLPLEGFAGCHLGGGVDDRTGTVGPLNASQSATGPMESGIGTYNGSAKARADYWSLGASAQGTATGGTSAFTYHQAAGFASFTDTLTLNKPGIAAGTAGFTNFTFLVEGLMSSLPHLPYTQQLDAALGIRVNGRFVWDSMLATVVNQNLPFLRGGSTGLPGSFVSGPGSLSGSALVTSTANFDIQWGVPFTVEVALRVNSSPCCYGTSQNVDFLNSALLKGIDAYGPGGKVDGFEVLTESGAHIGADGLQAVPEPGTWALLVSGLLIMLFLGFRARAPGQ
ncbi:MAG: PEP-CTERM sorting domain-containing protein [Rubrivivax sp.]|nr:MAG: PEP-CTERM sorting domain-containing protein [Rubrivivax sp.]